MSLDELFESPRELSSAEKKAADMPILPSARYDDLASKPPSTVVAPRPVTMGDWIESSKRRKNRE